MTTIHTSPPPGAPSFAIYEDLEDQEDGDTSFNSEMSLPGVDEAIPSIEVDDDAQNMSHRYSTSYTSRPSFSSQSRRESAVTSNSFVSTLPSEFSVSSKSNLLSDNLDSKYTPRKERPSFRNPASVRAMQMASPPPLPGIEPPRERLKGTYKLATPSKSGRSDSMSTTGSRRRRSHRESLHRDGQQRESPLPSSTPQQFPLVLLHVTILPMQMPYSHDMMVKIMPEWLVENYKLLEEKLQDIILMRRGLLIPHPRDEYELLEERILESLELKVPRLLKCGHFMGPEESEDDIDVDPNAGDGSGVTEEGTGRGSRMSGGTITADEDAGWKYPTPDDGEGSMCADCHRHITKPGKGVGAGTKRWDIKIYAANGLMRAGAWLAAWTEMERCDVEIAPWIPEEIRKSLDKRLLEEQDAAQRKQMYAAELQRRIEEEALQKKKVEEEAALQRRAEEIQAQDRREAEAAALHRKLEEEAAETRRLEATLYEKIEEAKETMRLEFEVQAMAEANSVAERLRAMEAILKKQQEKAEPPPAPPVLDDSDERTTANQSEVNSRSVPRQPKAEQVPLGTLLRNYFLLLLRDTRNFLLVILTALVIYLAMEMNENQKFTILSVEPVKDYANDAMSAVLVTSTATMTTTSIATVTVTALPSFTSTSQSLETILPTSDIFIDAAATATTSEAAPKASSSVEASSAVLEEFISSTYASENEATETSNTVSQDLNEVASSTDDALGWDSLDAPVPATESSGKVELETAQVAEHVEEEEVVLKDAHSESPDTSAASTTSAVSAVSEEEVPESPEETTAALSTPEYFNHPTMSPVSSNSDADASQSGNEEPGRPVATSEPEDDVLLDGPLADAGSSKESDTKSQEGVGEVENACPTTRDEL